MNANFFFNDHLNKCGLYVKCRNYRFWIHTATYSWECSEDIYVCITLSNKPLDSPFALKVLQFLASIISTFTKQSFSSLCNLLLSKCEFGMSSHTNAPLVKVKTRLPTNNKLGVRYQLLKDKTCILYWNLLQSLQWMTE